jgi:hypothetical protein
MSKTAMVTCGMLLSLSMPSANFALQAPEATNCAAEQAALNRMEQYLRWYEDAVYSPREDEIYPEAGTAAARLAPHPACFLAEERPA